MVICSNVQAIAPSRHRSDDLGGDGLRVADQECASGFAPSYRARTGGPKPRSLPILVNRRQCGMQRAVHARSRSVSWAGMSGSAFAAGTRLSGALITWPDSAALMAASAAAWACGSSPP